MLNLSRLKSSLFRTILGKYLSVKYSFFETVYAYPRILNEITVFRERRLASNE
jgi:hypothetical protein